MPLPGGLWRLSPIGWTLLAIAGLAAAFTESPAFALEPCDIGRELNEAPTAVAEQSGPDPRALAGPPATGGLSPAALGFFR